MALSPRSLSDDIPAVIPCRWFDVTWKMTSCFSAFSLALQLRSVKLFLILSLTQLAVTSHRLGGLMANRRRVFLFLIFIGSILHPVYHIRADFNICFQALVVWKGLEILFMGFTLIYGSVCLSAKCSFQAVWKQTVITRYIHYIHREGGRFLCCKTPGTKPNNEMSKLVIVEQLHWLVGVHRLKKMSSGG